MEKECVLRGELYYAFVPDLIAARSRCKQAYNEFNRSEYVSRHRLVELWKEYLGLVKAGSMSYSPIN